MARFISIDAFLFLCLSVITARAADDAAYIGCVIPDSLITDQVFEAKITMKNSGTTAWGQLSGQTPVTLVSQAPAFNMTWGTYFIILGQGKTIAPGDTVTFQSRLKAPGIPGKHAFDWRIQRWIKADTTTPFFGETVTGKSIVVTQRPQTPPSPPPHKDSLLDTSDFEYAGSIKLPDLPGQENTYTAGGLALKKTSGSTHLLARTGTYNFRLFEMDIPELVKIVNGDHSSVKTGTVVRDWGELEYATIGGERIGSNGGFWYDDGSGILYWSHHNAYFCGGVNDFPQLLATRLGPGETKTNLGHWYIPAAVQRYKSYWGGVTVLSKRFADAYTGGRDMAVGFGGYYSICGSASRGPALGAIAGPDSTDSILSIAELMTYPDPAASIRDGKYLPVVTFWDKPFPGAPWKGYWTYGDICHAGVFIDLPDKQGYLTFPNQVTGRIGYDYGGYNTDGHAQNCWYFYDLSTLGAVAKGLVRPDSVKPSSFVTFRYPFDRGIAEGACFDQETRTVYIYVRSGLPDRSPVIHAYRVKKNATEVYTAAPTVNTFEIAISANPFNPVIRIGVQSRDTRPDRIEIKIFDMKGTLIRTFVVPSVNGGARIAWDATNRPSGAYYCAVKMGKKEVTRKVMVIR